MTATTAAALLLLVTGTSVGAQISDLVRRLGEAVADAALGVASSHTAAFAFHGGRAVEVIYQQLWPTERVGPPDEVQRLDAASDSIGLQEPPARLGVGAEVLQLGGRVVLAWGLCSITLAGARTLWATVRWSAAIVSWLAWHMVGLARTQLPPRPSKGAGVSAAPSSSSSSHGDANVDEGAEEVRAEPKVTPPPPPTATTADAAAGAQAGPAMPEDLILPATPVCLIRSGKYRGCPYSVVFQYPGYAKFLGRVDSPRPGLRAMLAFLAFEEAHGFAVEAGSYA